MGNVVSSKVKWMRGLAFAFIVMFYVSLFFEGVIYHSLGRYTNMAIYATYLVYAALMVGLAAIKANRIYAVLFVNYLFLTIYLTVDFPKSAFWAISTLVLRHLLFHLIPLYCFSVILKNNYDLLDVKTQKWLPLLLLLPTVMFMTLNITYNYCFSAIANFKDLDTPDFWSYTVYSAPLYFIWISIMCIMALVATFKLIYSPAFGGNYNPNVKGDFNPLNKYFLGSLGAVAIGVAGLSALYYFGL